MNIYGTPNNKTVQIKQVLKKMKHFFHITTFLQFHYQQR